MRKKFNFDACYCQLFLERKSIYKMFGLMLLFTTTFSTEL